MLRLVFAVWISVLVGGSAWAQSAGEHIVVTGGPSLKMWEKYKIEPHDNWWLNFIRASRIRIDQLRTQYGPSAQITWMVYSPGYKRRQAQEKDNLFSVIDSVRAKYALNLKYFTSTQQLCNYLDYGNNRGVNKIATFDYFGHSNRACFMFDYSNEIGSASKAWLHETELKQKLRPGIFTPDAIVQSWGCYTGQSMSRLWYEATGAKMIGATCKTHYMTEQLPVLSSPGGKWVTGT